VYLRAQKVAHVCRRFFGYLVLFLCIGVMGREVPECMSLGDDVSNDCDVAVYNLKPPQGVSSCADTPDPGATSAFGNGSLSLIFLPSRFSRAVAPIGRAGVGLLRLIGQQRC
jgi:hypothetical protein